MRHPSRLAALLFAVLSAVFLWLWIAERRTTTQQTLDAARTANERKTLQTEIAARVNEIDSLRQQLIREGIKPEIPGRRPTPVPDESKRLEAIRSLAQAEQRITQLQTSLNETRERVGQLEAQLETQSAERRKLEEAVANLREDLAGAKRVIEASDAEIKSKAARITQLESTARSSRDAQTGDQKKVQEAATAVRELAEVDRRRENALQSIQRRFRDISDQYRNFALRLDTNRDNPAAAIPDVSRIQTAVQGVEDEMRQLNTLNSQARQAAQKIAASLR